MNKLRVRTVLLALLSMVSATLAVLTVGGSPAAASHYRATQISWHQTTGNSVEFHLNASWRCGFWFGDCSGGGPAAGTTFGADAINFGDGNFSDGQWTVVSVDPVNDVVNAEAHVPHTYATAGPWAVSLDSCCRLSGPQHINNPDGGVRVETVVDLTTTSASPQSSMAPIIDCPLNAVCSFVVPAFDSDGQGLAWRMSTAAESGGLSQPAGATINAGTGLYSWDTTGATLNAGGSSFYSTQVMVENVVSGNVVTKTPVDFFIRLTDTPNHAPVFQSPTPADGTTIPVNLGDPVTFSVNATDADSGDTVTLGMINKPAGATFATTNGNPATGTFTWTPTAVGTTIVNLTAQDGTGAGAVPRSITIVVGQAQTNQAPDISAASGSVQYSDALSFTAATATDPDGDSLTMSSGALPAALSGSDNGSGGYVVSGTATAAPGVYPVAYQASDGTANDTASGNITITKEDCTVSAPPTIQSVATGQTTLTATLGEPDSSLGDLSGKTVTFSGTDAANAPVGPWTATTNAAGTASVSVPLGEGVYGIGASFAGDSHYLACATTVDTVVTVAPAAYKVTGGGWVTQGTGRTSFGFNAKADVTGLRGQLQVRTASKAKFHGNVVSTLSGTGNNATWTGTGRWNGTAGYTFTVKVVDNGSGGRKAGDTISIVIKAPGGSTVFTTGGTLALKGGNIVVH